MPDARLDQLRSEAEAAIAQATTPQELEELRVKYLGRKSELTQILRSIATLYRALRDAGGSGRLRLSIVRGTDELRVTLALEGSPPSRVEGALVSARGREAAHQV